MCGRSHHRIVSAAAVLSSPAAAASTFLVRPGGFAPPTNHHRRKIGHHDNITFTVLVGRHWRIEAISLLSLNVCTTSKGNAKRCANLTASTVSRRRRLQCTGSSAVCRRLPRADNSRQTSIHLQHYTDVGKNKLRDGEKGDANEWCAVVASSRQCFVDTKYSR